MTESKIKPKWWWWKNVILPLVGTGGIGAIVIAMLSHNSGASRTSIQSINNGTVIGPTFNTIGNSNTINNSTTIITNPSDEEKVRANMKNDIRLLLSDVNPEALTVIDSGNQRIRIFISELKWRRFEMLMGYPEFTNYLQVISYSQVQMGGDNNSFGPGIYDSVRSGNIWALDLVVKNELRNSTSGAN